MLGAVYLMAIRNPPNIRTYGLFTGRRESVPDRALLVTSRRLLVLTDTAAGTSALADRGALVVSCPFARLLALQLRAHLLDCALTFLQDSADGDDRVSIPYSGVHEPAVIGVLMALRAEWDTCGGTVSDGAHTHAAEGGPVARQSVGVLDHRQRYYLHKCLAPDEQVAGFLAVPRLQRGNRLQRLSHTAEVQPPSLLVRTDRQFVLVKYAPRLVGTQYSYGSDAWLMPLSTLAGVDVTAEQPALTFRLGHAGTGHSVHLGLPSSLVADARVLVGTLHS